MVSPYVIIISLLTILIWFLQVRGLDLRGADVKIFHNAGASTPTSEHSSEFTGRIANRFTRAMNQEKCDGHRSHKDIEKDGQEIPYLTMKQLTSELYPLESK